MTAQKFLEKTAEYILEKLHADLLNTIVVFPNKRPIVFLKKYLKQQMKTTMWLPEMMSIDDFVSTVSGLEYEDPLRIYFLLYNLHKSIAGNHARPLDDFLNWAPVILHDFEDADFALADTSELFSYLTDARALEQWNPDGTPLTEMQQTYVNFYRSQADYYNKLKHKLLKQKCGYRALVYRYLYENITTIASKFTWTKFVFVGFNALTTVEQGILKYLKDNFYFEYIIDGDSFYLNTYVQQQKEAGRFLNGILDKWNLKNPKWVGNLLTTDKKYFETVAVPLSIGQVRYAGQIVDLWLNNGIKPLDMAIVLGNENLLVPLLNSLPTINKNTGDKIPYNVTLGYPLSQSPYRFFIETWLELLRLKNEESAGKIFVPVFINLLHSVLFRFLLGDISVLFEKQFAQQNRVMIDEEELKEMFLENSIEKLWHILFSNLGKPYNYLSSLFNLLETVSDKISSGIENGNILWEYQTELLKQQLSFIDSVIKDDLEEITWKTMQKLFLGIFNRNSINLRGEPLTGIQIMGVLETRSLDFDNIILLDVNEGILPKSNFKDTLIPMDIRRKFGLALPQDTSAVYAYHFFRMLHYTKRAVFTYNSQAGELSGGEKSRFLLQIQDELLPENPNINYQETFLESKIEDVNNDISIVVDKDEAIITKLNALAEYGFSPSALNSYINCSLQFYFRYILNLKEEETIETSVEANTFGSVVHGALFDLYSSFIGKKIDVALLNNKLHDIDTVLKMNFKKQYKTSDLSYGRNLLIFNVAKEYITRFVKYDVSQLKLQSKVIVSLEKKFESHIPVDKRKIKIKGFFDRIDTDIKENDIRIIDYKTGAVSQNELSPKVWETIIESDKYAKAFQVLLYAWMYKKEHPEILNIHPGIISLRSLSKGFMEVKLPDRGSDIVTAINTFESILSDLLHNIFDISVPFVQRNDSKLCEYCAYNAICNR